jgi:glucose-6-phosphate isomerase
MANWVADNFESIYPPIKEKRGGAYFLLETGIVANKKYDHVPEIRLFDPANIKELGLQKKKEMYGLVRDLDKLEFLKKPNEYEWVFEYLLNP